MFKKATLMEIHTVVNNKRNRGESEDERMVDRRGNIHIDINE